MMMSIWWVGGAFVLGFYTALLLLALMSIAAAGELGPATTAEEAAEPDDFAPVTPAI